MVITGFLADAHVARLQSVEHKAHLGECRQVVTTGGADERKQRDLEGYSHSVSFSLPL